MLAMMSCTDAASGSTFSTGVKQPSMSQLLLIATNKTHAAGAHKLYRKTVSKKTRGVRTCTIVLFAGEYRKLMQDLPAMYKSS